MVNSVITCGKHTRGRRIRTSKAKFCRSEEEQVLKLRLHVAVEKSKLAFPSGVPGFSSYLLHPYSVLLSPLVRDDRYLIGETEANLRQSVNRSESTAVDLLVTNDATVLLIELPPIYTDTSGRYSVCQTHAWSSHGVYPFPPTEVPK
jgi:hypothetical protein